jgi:hypothetical protein
MSELDRALALLERLVVAAEAMAARDARPAKRVPRPTITPEARHKAVREKLRRAGAMDR